MKTWIRALCLIGIVAAPNVVEISEAWAEPKRQAADDLMKEGWLSSLMARVSPKAADEAAPFVRLPRVPCTKSCVPSRSG
jgi:hypothetical protein